MSDGEQIKQAAPKAARDEAREASPAGPAKSETAATPEPAASQSRAQTSAAGAPEPVAPVQVAASRSSATAIAWLAILIALVVAVGFFYTMLEQQRRESDLLQRVQALESLTGDEGDANFEQMSRNLRRQVELEIEGIQARQRRSEEDLQRSLQLQQQALSRLESMPALDPTQTVPSSSPDQLQNLLSQQLQPLRQTLEQQDQALREQRQRLNDLKSLSEGDRDSWQLAEAQYLLRLANQRIVMSGDTTAAGALLRSADNLLRQLGDASLFDLRAAVAADLAALQAVPKLDLQGLYLRLDALIRQTDALVMFKLPERQTESAPPLEGDWKARLSGGYDTALKKLSEYVVVSRRDVPVEALMDPQYESLVRQNMRMLLEQAQVAMLSGNERLFRKSLERAAGWVSQFFKSDDQAAVAMSEELQAIRDERVSVDLPDVSASLQALDAVMRARFARSGN